MDAGDAARPTAPPPDPPRPTTVAVSPATAELSALGATVQLTAEVRDQSGNLWPGAAVTWTSSVAAVATVSSSGLVTAGGNGTASVVATSGSTSGSAQIVVEQAVATVRLWPRSVALLVGETVRLEATALDARDAEVPGAEFGWSSNDTTVATVDGTGLVHARAVGAVAVAASFGEFRDSASVAVSSAGPVGHDEALTAGLPERPFVNMTVGGQEGSIQTVGTLRLGLQPDAFPVIIDQGDMAASVLVAGSILGSGRVVAFSGQDFLGSDERATLVGHEHVDRLLANAVRWAAGDRAEPLRVLADNQRVAGALKAQGLEGVDVVGRGQGSRDRDWSANALGDADVAVVQVNEWGTARLTGESVAPLRAFVESGGGLVIAGSALHWSWWIEGDHGAFAGNTLLLGTGISWNEDSIDEIGSATTRVDLRALTPAIIWGQYVSGDCSMQRNCPCYRRSSVRRLNSVASMNWTRPSSAWCRRRLPCLPPPTLRRGDSQPTWGAAWVPTSGRRRTLGQQPSPAFPRLPPAGRSDLSSWTRPGASFPQMPAGANVTPP